MSGLGTLINVIGIVAGGTCRFAVWQPNEGPEYKIL